MGRDRLSGQRRSVSSVFRIKADGLSALVSGFQAMPDRTLHRTQIERLFNEAGNAAACGFPEIFRSAICRGDDAFDLGVIRSHALHDLKPVHIGKAEIDDEDIVIPLTPQPEGCAAVRGRVHPHVIGGESEGEGLADGSFIIYNEKVPHLFICFRVARNQWALKLSFQHLSFYFQHKLCQGRIPGEI